MNESAQPAHDAVSDQLRPLFAVLIGTLWATYSLNGFRPPTQAITLSDANAGSAIRQALFAGSAALSLFLFFRAGKLWAVIKQHWHWVLFGLWTGISVIYSEQPSITIKRAVLTNCGLFSAFFIVAYAGKSSILRITWFIAILCAVAAAMSLIWKFALPADITTNPGRPGLAGISNHPNTIAPAFALGTILWSSIRSSTRSAHAIRIIALLCCAYALLLTGSMTSVLLCTVGIAVAFLAMSGGYISALIILIISVAGIAVMLVGPGAISEEFFNSINRDASMSGRDQLWAIIVEQIGHYPVFGHGWGAFWTEGKGRELVETWNPRQAHNAYLDMLLDLGLVGLCIVLLPVVMALRSCVLSAHNAVNKETRRAAAGLLGCLVSILVVYGFQQSFLGKPDSFVFAILLWIAVASTSEQTCRPESIEP